ncbi:unnamed protein product [Cyprideis torosa]|uniref:Uncharacterized protein n=1 Tax=Cyprideis torosa TaxID=163714 RepID=A0A7R8ZQP7_9CRUS|nr:unnamed protein product [Cyprideis torosa]CAG0903438.1 unnamed protein product [Cyprideis torosa]
MGVFGPTTGPPGPRHWNGARRLASPPSSSKSMYEMLHTASLCSKRGSEDLSFGEFAFFATELRHVYDHGSPAIIHSRLKAYKPRRLDRRLSRSAVQYDVFLGGSCNPTTWRRDLAIPQFKKKGITYYNPQVPSWRPEFIELEHQAKLGASLLLFVIDNRTRGTASVIEAAYLAATGRRLLLVIIPFAGPGQIVCGEPISEREYEDLKHGQVVLTDLVERQSLPVFSSVQHALDIAPDLLRAGEHPCDLGPSSIVTPVRMGHVVLGDRLMKLRDAFDALDSQGTGKLNLNEVSMAFRIISHRNLSPAEISALMEMPSARSVPLKIVEEGNKYMFPPTPSSEGITPPPSPPLPPDKENTDGKAAYSRSNFSNQASLEVDFDAFCAMVAEFRNPETTRSVSSVREESLSSSVRLTVTSALCGGSSILPHRPTPNPFRRMSTLGDLFGKASSYTLQVLKPLQKAIGWVPSSPTTNGPPSPTSRHPHQRPSYARDVYLGGSMGHTTWRKAVAIPLLK